METTVDTSEETVFFLGAGASASYGFPCGNNLILRIIKDINSGGRISKYLISDLGYSQKDLRYFGTTFFEARTLTIDEFLESRSDLKQLGRILVSLMIINLEDKFQFRKISYDWLTVYIRNLLDGVTTLSDARKALDKVRFVTLNYDRSVEYLLFTLLKARYTSSNVGSSFDKQILASINGMVYHMHGSVGELSIEETQSSRPYERSIPPKKVLEKISQNVAFWDDLSSKSEPHSSLMGILSNSRQIFILGFGFHRGITSRFSPNIFSDKKIFCTIKGIGNWKWSDVISLLCPTATAMEIPPFAKKNILNVRFSDRDQTCDGFMLELFQE